MYFGIKENQFTRQTMYESTIIDDGGDVPMFRVTSLGNYKISFTRTSPSSAWMAVAKEVYAARKALSGGGIGPLGSVAALRQSISGPVFFGLQNEDVMFAIEGMKNADKCGRYVFHALRTQAQKTDPKTNTAAIKTEEELVPLHGFGASKKSENAHQKPQTENLNSEPNDTADTNTDVLNLLETAVTKDSPTQKDFHKEGVCHPAFAGFYALPAGNAIPYGGGAIDGSDLDEELLPGRAQQFKKTV
jgi:hypothetical protein